MTAPTLCSICRRPGPWLDAGGDVGLVHPRCFGSWDAASEALELVTIEVPVPDPLEVLAPRRAARRAA